MILLYPIVALGMAASLLPWISLSLFINQEKELKQKENKSEPKEKNKFEIKENDLTNVVKLGKKK